MKLTERSQVSKRKVGDVLWLALQCAKQDRKSLTDAYRNNKSEKVVREALADIKAFEQLQIKLFGTDRSRLQATMAKMKPVDILKLLGKDMDEIERIIEAETEKSK